jgi:hypothetical protein
MATVSAEFTLTDKQRKRRPPEETLHPEDDQILLSLGDAAEWKRDPTALCLNFKPIWEDGNFTHGRKTSNLGRDETNHLLIWDFITHSAKVSEL